MKKKRTEQIDTPYFTVKTLKEEKTGKVIKPQLPKNLTLSMDWHKDIGKEYFIVPLIKYNSILVVNPNSKLTEKKFYTRAMENYYKNEPEKREKALRQHLTPLEYFSHIYSDSDPLHIEPIKKVYKESRGKKGATKALKRLGIIPLYWDAEEEGSRYEKETGKQILPSNLRELQRNTPEAQEILEKALGADGKPFVHYPKDIKPADLNLHRIIHDLRIYRSIKLDVESKIKELEKLKKQEGGK